MALAFLFFWKSQGLRCHNLSHGFYRVMSVKFLFSFFFFLACARPSCVLAYFTLFGTASPYLHPPWSGSTRSFQFICFNASCTLHFEKMTKHIETQSPNKPFLVRHIVRGGFLFYLSRGFSFFFFLMKFDEITFCIINTFCPLPFI